MVIRMYHDDHSRLHFHVSDQAFEAFVAIATGAIIGGGLPQKAARIVRRRAQAHRAELGEAGMVRKAAA